MKIPEHPDVKEILWDMLHMDDRVSRAQAKVYLKGQDPSDNIRDMSNQAFDFYGGYSRITEPTQKKKYIET